MKSSFKIYSEIYPKHTPWVHSKLFKRTSQFGSILPHTLKEPIEYMVGYSMGKLLGIL